MLDYSRTDPGNMESEGKLTVKAGLLRVVHDPIQEPQETIGISGN